MTKFAVRYSMSGYSNLTIDTYETEEELMDRLCEKDDSEIEADSWSVDAIDVDRMYLVERPDGSRVWTTYVKPEFKVIE